MGLSDSAFSILYAMCELGGGCLQRDICQTAYLRKQTVNSAIGKMVRQGLLRMEPGKRRDMHLYLTEKGQAAARRTVLPVRRMEDAALAAMTPQERAELLRLTKAYLDRLERSAGTAADNIIGEKDIL